MRCIYQVELLPTTEQADILHATMARFTEACQYVKVYAQTSGEFSQSKLQQQLYLQLRERFELGAQVAVLVIKQVADTYRFAGSLPDFIKPDCMLYDQRTCRFLNEVVVSLWTLQGRKLIPYQPITPGSVERNDGQKGGTSNVLDDRRLVQNKQPHKLRYDPPVAPEPDIAELIPFACEEIELCVTGNNKLILNMVYRRHTLEHLAQIRKKKTDRHGA